MENRHQQHQTENEYLTNCHGPCKPVGVAFFGAFFKFTSISAKRTFHKSLVLCITFLAYTCFHMGRRPLSIVKNVLNRNCSQLHNTLINNQPFNLQHELTFQDDYYFSPLTSGGLTASGVYEDGTSGEILQPLQSYSINDTSCDWPPFDNDATANQLLALLDSAFLFSYAVFMFISGFLADRCNLRYYLSGGMILSGALLYAFGLTYYLNIHSMTYLVIVQLLAGAIQTTGWPSVVSCIGNWFDQSSRGSIFGLWNANTNLGNILGAVIAGYFVESAWGLSFIVPGFIMFTCGILAFLFLVPRPEDVNLHSLRTCHVINYRDQDIEEAVESIVPSGDNYRANRRKLPRVSSRDSAMSATDSTSRNFNPQLSSNGGESSPLISGTNTPTGSPSTNDQGAVSFWTCLTIPGVVEYSLCLGFAKLVSYTFLYWLPRYITQSTLNSSEQSAYLSVPFDIGGMFGAIVAGYLSDRYKKSAITCVVLLVMAIPSMLIYERFASISNFYNITLQLMTGFLVNGPYALITTAVSTDLGSRVKDGRAMATVAAIIDGTGSIGAAVGPLFAGYISDSGWESVFIMLMLSDLIAAFCLTRVFLKELGLK